MEALNEDLREALALELLDKFETRYQIQAQKFLKDTFLEIEIHDALLRYIFKKPFMESEISYDSGKSFRWLEGSRINPHDRKDLKRICWEFAFSEARAILER